ncbi:MAG: hypothetical protein KAI97_02500 [Gemmatimonadetes bacterium]|nr:hypothetical protein [Gemmatimonadota bacterium]
MTSIPVMVGVLVAAVAVVYAFVQNHRQVREGQAIKKWVLANAPEVWESLGPLHRRWLSPEVGLTVLRRKRAIDDPAFEQQFEQMREFGRKKLQALIAGTIAILIVLVGTKLFGWAW